MFRLVGWLAGWLFVCLFVWVILFNLFFSFFSRVSYGTFSFFFLLLGLLW